MPLEEVLRQIVDKVAGWLEALILMVPNLVGAVVVVVAFWLAARLIRNWIRRLMDRLSPYHQVNRLVGTVGYVAVIAAGAFVALGILDLDKTVTSLLAGAGIVGLALGFAFQDIAANFISGILLSVRRPFKEGDIIETNDYFGTVDAVNLRATLLRTPQGQTVVIPNKEVFQNALINHSTSGARRVDLRCGVSYGDDLDAAERVALDAMRSVEARDPDRDVTLFYEEFGGSSVNFVVCFWITYREQADFLRARSEAVKRLKQAFDAHGLTIPFPIRTLDFGVVGGEKLSDVLPRHLYASNGRTAAEKAD